MSRRDLLEQEPESPKEALTEEMARVREEVLPAYEEIGPAGMFAETMMRRALAKADRALAADDAGAMLECWRELVVFDT